MKKIIKVTEKYPPEPAPAFYQVSPHRLKWLEWITLILGFWFLFHPDPYRLLLAILLVIPIFGILLNSISRPSIASLITIEVKGDGDVGYDVADFIDVVAIVLAIRMLLDFKLELWWNLILPGMLSFLLVVGILFLTHRRIVKNNGNRNPIYWSLLIYLLCYAYAGTYAVNCAFERNVPEVYPVKVMDVTKRENYRKRRRRYAITVAPWGKQAKQEKIYVNKARFEGVEAGDTIYMNRYNGLLGIPWYKLSNVED